MSATHHAHDASSLHQPGRRHSSLRDVLRAIHNDDRGTVSLETTLIIAAVALPVLIIIIKFGWPKIKDYFDRGMGDMERETDRAIQGR